MDPSLQIPIDHGDDLGLILFFGVVMVILGIICLFCFLVAWFEPRFESRATSDDQSESSDEDYEDFYLYRKPC